MNSTNTVRLSGTQLAQRRVELARYYRGRDNHFKSLFFATNAARGVMRLNDKRHAQRIVNEFPLVAEIMTNLHNRIKDGEHITAANKILEKDGVTIERIGDSKGIELCKIKKGTGSGLKNADASRVIGKIEHRMRAEEISRALHGKRLPVNTRVKLARGHREKGEEFQALFHATRAFHAAARLIDVQMMGKILDEFSLVKEVNEKFTEKMKIPTELHRTVMR